MTEKDGLKSAYLAVMSDIDNMIHRGLNKIESELGKGNKAEAYQSVLDTASLGNALFDLGVLYRAKFELVGEEVETMTDEVRLQNYRCVIDDLKEQIECMKKSGRRRRAEVRRLKKILIEEQARSRIAIMTALSKRG